MLQWDSINSWMAGPGIMFQSRKEIKICQTIYFLCFPHFLSIYLSMVVLFWLWCYQTMKYTSGSECMVPWRRQFHATQRGVKGEWFWNHHQEAQVDVRWIAYTPGLVETTPSSKKSNLTFQDIILFIKNYLDGSSLSQCARFSGVAYKSIDVNRGSLSGNSLRKFLNYTLRPWGLLGQ